MRSSLKAIVSCLFLAISNVIAIAAIMPGNGSGWLVVGSRPESSTAIQVARELAARVPGVHVFQSSNGWYAITLGWSRTNAGNQYKNQLIAQGIIPDDSYFHNGQRFVNLHWSTTGLTGSNTGQIIGATRLSSSGSGGGGNVTKTGYVTGLNPSGDNYLSLRSRPTSKGRELYRMGPNTPLIILGKRKRWYQVRLNDGREGWAYGKYIALNKPATPPPAPPKPQIIVDNSDNGLELEVAGLTRSGAFLSLRTGPGTSNREIARLRNNTRMMVTGKSQGWFRVRPDGASVEGWVSGKYVQPFEIPLIGPTDPIVKDDSEDTSQDSAKLEDEEAEIPKPPASLVIDGKRVALVLGNSAYEHTVELANPKNDADKISERLRSLGFEVIVGLDETKAGMENTVRDFVRILPDADVALFFYAGHAMQVNGQNYLVPIDAKLADSTAIDFETINLSSVLGFIDKPGRISIALLDACRDNPLSRSFAKTLGPTRSAFLGRGLASPDTGGGNILIGFATAPGEVALDGAGDNSPFTEALLKHMSTPDVEIELMLKRVKADVFETTGGKQAPWHNSALRKEFYFAKNE